MRRLLVMFLVSLAVVGGWIAPQGAVAGDADTLVYSWSSNVGHLNPHMYSPNQMYAQNLVYEPLVRYGDGGVIKPCLATAWTVSPDGRVYTFTLRKGVVFSDGTPFDAVAVKKNLDAVMANRKRHKWLELINQMQSVDVVSSHEVRITMAGSYYPVLQELALIRPARFLSPAAFPDDGLTANGIKAPVGTGPWKVVSMKKGEYDILEANESYWGEKPKMKRLVIKVIPDSNARAVAFDTGEIDLIFGSGGHGAGQIGLETFERYQGTPGVVAATSKPMSTRNLALNSNRFPTNDLAVRKAILHAVNKAAMVKHIFLGVEPEAHTLFSTNMPYCNIGLKPFAYDKALAAKQLDAAGWTLPAGAEYRVKNGKELALDLCFVGNDALQKSVAEVVQGNLRSVGVRVNLVGEEKDSFLVRQKQGEFGMIFGDTDGPPYDPHSFCSAMRVPSHADYQAQLGLPMKADIDAAIGKVLVSVDEKARQDLYTYILTTLHEQAVYMPLTHITTIAVHRPELEGVDFSATKYEFPFERIFKR